MTLRWEQDGHGDWRGHSGAQRVAIAHKAFTGRDRWYWAMSVGVAYDREGLADTPEAARAAAEAAWAEWCRTAGLAPVGVDGWRPIETARPRSEDDTFLVFCAGLTVSGPWVVAYFQEAHWRAAITAEVLPWPTHWRPLPPPPGDAP